jgi:TonB family protein
MMSAALLLSLLWKSAIVFALAGAAAFLLRRRPAALTHAIWMVAFLAAAALPFGEAWLPSLAAPPAIAFLVNTGAAAASPSTTADGAGSLAFSIWLAGAALAFGRLAIGHARVARLVRRSTDVAREGTVSIRESATSCVPLAWGLFRPVIVLPRAAQTWPQAMRDDVLRHEFSHIARGDLWWLLFTQLVCCFYWFQPLAWWAARRAAHDSEHACDDLVLSNAASAPDYAAHLVELARATLAAPWPVAAVVRPSGLELRVRAILDPHRDRRQAGRATWPLAIAAALAVLIPIAALRAQDRIYSMKDDGVKAPRLLHKVEPKYTEQARDAKLEGKVVLKVVITKKGEPTGITVLQSLEPGLDANAVDAVSQWLFEPGTRKGEPVAVQATIEVNFRLL